MTGPPDEAAPRTLELTAASRGGRAPTRTAVGVLVGTQVGFLLVILLLAVALPPARIFLAAWVVWVVFAVALALRRSRRQSRGLTRASSLWLTADRAGYTNTHGVTISCARAPVQSAVRAYVTLGSRIHDVLILRDAQDNALLEAPLARWRPSDIDRFTEELGVGTAHPVFIDSVATLQRVAHGMRLDDSIPARAYRGYQRASAAVLMYTMALSVAAGIAAVCGVVLWTITGRSDAGNITGFVLFFLTAAPLLLFTHRIRRGMRMH